MTFKVNFGCKEKENISCFKYITQTRRSYVGDLLP